MALASSWLGLLVEQVVEVVVQASHELHSCETVINDDVQVFMNSAR